MVKAPEILGVLAFFMIWNRVTCSKIAAFGSAYTNPL